METIRLLAESFREKGVVRTVRIVASHFQDLAFDFKYKTDTTQWVALENLTVVGRNKKHGFQYQPTQERAIRKIFSESDLPTGGVFLDIGCGKGRVLMIASDYGFQKLEGVEFSEKLCDIARKNLAIYSAGLGRAIKCEIIHADASDFQIGDQTSVVFLCNPFDETVMTHVVTHIRDSLKRRPRDLYIIYVNPTCRQLFENTELFDVVAEYGTAQAKYLIYRAQHAIHL